MLLSHSNGSYLTLTGPAAGLSAVIFSAVQSLGEGDAMTGYRYTLAAIVASGVLQTLMGFFRAGRLSALFPTAVVHGMLTAIAIIIMAKQIPVMAGVKAAADANTSMLSSILQLPYELAFLLVFVAAFPRVIDRIPLASLAALLVYAGFRLASPEAFAKTMDLGKEQLALFVITIVGVLATTLLGGVLIGIAAKRLLPVGRGVPPKNLLTISNQIEHAKPGTHIIRVRGSAIVPNFPALKSALAGACRQARRWSSTCPTPLWSITR